MHEGDVAYLLVKFDRELDRLEELELLVRKPTVLVRRRSLEETYPQRRMTIANERCVLSS
jgi:hypothetical protein